MYSVKENHNRCDSWSWSRPTPTAKPACMPTEQMLAEMGQLQRGAGQGRRHARRRRPAAQLEGRPRPVRRRQADRRRRPVRRDQGADRRLLDLQVKSKEEAIEWVKRCPNPMTARPRSRSARSSRPRTSATALTPELREQEARLREQIAQAALRAERRWPRMASTADAARAAIDAVWRIESARLIAGLTRMVARRRPGRGAGAGRAGRGAGAVARERRPGQPGRLADGHRQAPGDRPVAPRRAARSARRGASAASWSRQRSRGARSSTRRSTTPIGDDLLRLVFIACHPVLSTRGAGGADAAAARRPDHRRDRPRVPRARADDRPAHRARQADAGRGAGAVRGAARRRARRAAGVGARGHLPGLQRGLLGHAPATTGCGRRCARTRCGWAGCSPS